MEGKRELRKELTPYRVYRLCPQCGGTMKWVSATITGNPPLYPHRCKDCGYEETYMGKSYPCIEFREE